MRFIAYFVYFVLTAICTYSMYVCMVVYSVRMKFCLCYECKDEGWRCKWVRVQGILFNLGNR